MRIEIFKLTLITIVLILCTVLFAATGHCQQSQANYPPNFDANAYYVQSVAPGYRPSKGSGLTLNIAKGTANCSGTRVAYAGSTLTMTNTATNYVYLDPAAACAPTSNTSAYPLGTVWIAQVVAAGGVITTITDDRTWFAVTNFSTTGTVTITGSPVSGNLTKWSGASSITNGDLSGDCTTSGSLVIICTKTNSVSFAASATTDATNASNISSGTLATARMAAAALIRDCEIVVGDPGAGSSVLADDNDTPAVCANDFGVDYTITAVACWADAGSPTVTPILTGGTSTSILTGALTCGIASWAAGTVNGTPTVHTFSSNGATCSSTPCTIDANTTTAGGTAKYYVLKIKRTL